MTNDSNERFPLNEAGMKAEFERNLRFPPLRLRLLEPPQSRPAALCADALVDVSWDSQTYRFAAEFKARSTPKAFREAVQQAQQWALALSRLPLIVLPHLGPKQLEELQQSKVSGIDLSGNGVVVVPKKLLVYRTGNPNRFPDSLPTKYAYRGTTSLVARAFLCRPRYDALADIADEVQRRGAAVAISTVSKALKRMEEDVVVERVSGKIQLLQADKLLQLLADNYRPPQVWSKATFSTKLAMNELLALPTSEARMALSGKSSIAAYAVMGRDEHPVLFTDNIGRLRQAWGDRVQETSRFIDFELRETNDPTVYFDVRWHQGLPYASPIQVFLECSSGDKREKETARQVRDFILQGLPAGGGG